MDEKDHAIKLIDLGLPSGTLWADRNLNSINPEDLGIETMFSNLNAIEFSQEFLPTIEQFEELFSNEFVEINPLQVNNLWGYKIESKINHKSIFMPVGNVWINNNGVTIHDGRAYATKSLHTSKPLEGKPNPQTVNIAFFLHHSGFKGPDNVKEGCKIYIRLIKSL